MNRSVRLALLLLAALILSPIGTRWARAAQHREAALPPVHHVFLIVLQDESFATAFGSGSAAPYLAKTLPARGALLQKYYAIGHWGLDNYIALISGQAPNIATRRNCRRVWEFRMRQQGLASDGQAEGSGCIYPAIVKTLPDQLEKAGLTWKGYMQDLNEDPIRDKPATCSGVRSGQQDETTWTTGDDQYTASHNPFIYFHTILDDPAGCAAHVAGLDELMHDLRGIASTPSFSFIVPDMCQGGQERYCSDHKPGGLGRIDGFLRTWVPVITRSAAFRKDGLLIVTFDQSSGLIPADFDACCNEKALPGDPEKPGLRGPGGGIVGAVVLSPFVRPGTVSTVPYNHYALLRTVEDLFGLGHLGYAGQSGLRPFGSDVFQRR